MHQFVLFSFVCNVQNIFTLPKSMQMPWSTYVQKAIAFGADPQSWVLFFYPSSQQSRLQYLAFFFLVFLQLSVFRQYKLQKKEMKEKIGACRCSHLTCLRTVASNQARCQMAGPLWYHINICLKWDLNQGPKRLSLLEFATWRLRPLGHHSRLISWVLTAQRNSCKIGSDR